MHGNSEAGQIKKVTVFEIKFKQFFEYSEILKIK